MNPIAPRFRMRTHLRPAGIAVLVGAGLLANPADPAHAHDDGLTCHEHPGFSIPFESILIQEVSFPKLYATPLVYRATSGELTIGRVDTAAVLGDGSVKFLSDSIHVGIYRGDTLRGGDLDGDGHPEAIVSSRLENAMTVVWGDEILEAERRMTRRRIGPGPAGVELVDRGRPGGGRDLLVPLTATETPRLVLLGGATLEEIGTVPLDPAMARARLFATAAVPATDTMPNWVMIAASQAHSASCASAEPPILEILTVDANAAAAGIPGVRKFSNITLKRGVMSAMGGHLTGRDMAPWFVLMNAEDPVVEVIHAEANESMLFTFPDGVSSMRPAPRLDDDAVVVTFHGGLHAALYEFDPVNGFELLHELDPPENRSWSGISGLGDGRLLALDSPQGGGGAPDSFALLEDAGVGFTPIVQGVLPGFAPFPTVPAIKLFTADPFGPGGFEFQSFPGDWARGAAFDGTEVSAIVESFLGSSSGLGNPMAATFVPVGDPGSAAVALGNQWDHEASSLFFPGAPHADGDAAVAIAPQPGSFSVPIVVSLSAAPDTQIVFRTGGGGWQGYGGPFVVASDTIVDFYGQAEDGTLSGIQSAAYQIDQVIGSDLNKDGMPDVIAAALGLDPGGDGDSDGDGVSDIEEILNGGDPADRSSLPDSLEHRFPPRLEFRVTGLLPASVAGGADVPVPAGTPVQLTSLDGALMADGSADRSGIAELTWNAPAASDVDGRDFLIWQSNRGTATPLFSLMLVSMRALPDPDASLSADAMVAKWIDDVIATLPDVVEVEGLRTGKLAQTDYAFELPLDADTTLATFGFAAWSAEKLEEGGRVKVRFPWDSRSRPLVTSSDLRILEVPSGPDLVAHEVVHVLQQALFEPLVEEDGELEPLSRAAREIFRAAGARGADLPSAGTALGMLVEERRLLTDYASAVSTPENTLIALRDLWLGSPEPRPVLDVEGILVRGEDGGWLVLTSGGTLYAALTRDEMLVVDDDASLVEHRRFSFPLGQPVVPGAFVRLVGLPLSAAVPGIPRIHEGAEPVEVVSLVVVDAEAGSSVDEDADDLDDAWELLFFGGMQQDFWSDFDGDGFADGEERLAGTDPGDAGQFPPGTPALPSDIELAIADDGSVIVTWLGSSAATYFVEIGEITAGFDPSPTLPVETEPEIFQWIDTDGAAANRRFYRVGVMLGGE